MEEIIKISTDENGNQLVSGRELHEQLGVKDNYTDWFKRMISYGFAENVDFISLSEKSDKPSGGRPSINHALKLSMAKEVAMIQRNERGKQIRLYFIEVEEQYKQQQLNLSKLSPTMQALISLDLKTQELEQRLDRVEERQMNAIETDLEFIDTVPIFIPDLTYSTTEIAEELGTTPKRLNQFLKDLGVIYPKRHGVTKSVYWHLYAKLSKKGLKPTGSLAERQRWTEDGRTYIKDLYTKAGDKKKEIKVIELAERGLKTIRGMKTL